MKCTCERSVLSINPRKRGICVSCGYAVWRNRQFENYFIESAERKAGLKGIGFHEEVSTRLEEGEHLYGNNAVKQSLSSLRREIREEAFDLAAWSALALQSREFADLDDDCRIAASLMLQEIAARGVEVSYFVKQLENICVGV